MVGVTRLDQSLIVTQTLVDASGPPERVGQADAGVQLRLLGCGVAVGAGVGLYRLGRTPSLRLVRRQREAGAVCLCRFGILAGQAVEGAAGGFGIAAK